MVEHCIEEYCMVEYYVEYIVGMLYSTTKGGRLEYCMVQQGIGVLYGIVWYCMVLYGIVWYCVVLYVIV